MESICWICRGPCPSDKIFCKCFGELKTVHQECLSQWIQASMTKRCTFCRHYYSIDYTLRPWWQWRWIPLGEENGGHPCDWITVYYFLWSILFFLGCIGLSIVMVVCGCTRTLLDRFIIVGIPLVALMVPLVVLSIFVLSTQLIERFWNVNCTCTVRVITSDGNSPSSRGPEKD
ncbi:E3-MARCH8-like protein [Marmot herpesvirus 1]|nr:E3-MARCH8-like protein [Marmot herpesvirus 1]